MNRFFHWSNTISMAIANYILHRSIRRCCACKNRSWIEQWPFECLSIAQQQRTQSFSSFNFPLDYGNVFFCLIPSVSSHFFFKFIICNPIFVCMLHIASMTQISNAYYICKTQIHSQPIIAKHIITIVFNAFWRHSRRFFMSVYVQCTCLTAYAYWKVTI